MKINLWLLEISNGKYPEGVKIPSEDKLYFESLCKKVYTYLLSFPSPTYCKYMNANRTFYFAIGHNVLNLEWNKDVSDHDFCEIVYNWAYKFFPHYTVKIKEARSLSEEEMLSEVYKGKSLEDLIFEEAFEEKIENFKIEKIVIRDDQINVKINNKKYVLISRPDMPISRFIQKFRKIEHDEDKAKFVKNYTKKILEVQHMKPIDIKYVGKQLMNFFKARSPVLNPEPFEKMESLTYKWGRFIIYFSDQSQIKQAREIITKFKTEYKSIKNIDAYIQKEFNGKITYENSEGKQND